MRPPARRTPHWLRWSAAGGALVAYLFLTGAVWGGGPAGPDAYLLGAFHGVRAPWLDSGVLLVTQLGDYWAMTALSVVAVAALARVSGRSAIFVASAMLGAAVINLALKVATARPRPNLAPVYDPGGYAFPSGHAMATFCFFVALALVVRQLRCDWQWRAAVVALVAIAVVGTSRVYLGVHYPTDVVAGWAIGAVWLGLLYAWYRRGFVATPVTD
jgi:undecaprenyl-diphosphatase